MRWGKRKNRRSGPSSPTGPGDDLQRRIDDFGWAVRNVVDPDPARCLSYTIGLSLHDHPEVVMTGLPPKTGTAFLNIVGDVVVGEGGRFEAGVPTTALAEGTPMPVIAVEDRSALTAIDALVGEVPVLQIVWPDAAGRLPWDDGYANAPGSQPLLGARPAD